MLADSRKWHFGVLAFTGTGHLTPLLSLAQELKRRGHRVTLFEKPKIAERVREAGLEFQSVGARETTAGQIQPPVGAGAWSEIAMLRFNLNRISCDLRRFLEDTPAATRNAGVDVLIVNEVALTGPTVAEVLGLPYFLVSISVPHSFGWSGFPLIFGYRYSRSWLSWIQRTFLEMSCLHMRGPIRWALNRSRREIGLAPIRTGRKDRLCLGHVTRMPEWLDIPRKSLPDNFCYAGPFAAKDERPYVEFPWERLDGRPLIYASLGTTRNVQPMILRQIAEACAGLDVQLVISLGNRFDVAAFADLPGNPIVVKYAPQLELLKIAEIVITHGGSNTAFETLTAGKPMIVIPLAYDQPALAARLARLNIAEILPVMRLSPQRIRTAILKLLDDVSYRNAAATMQKRISSLNGVERAAEFIEQALDRFQLNREMEAEENRKSCSCALGANKPASCVPGQGLQ